jgi:hypothetical protein
MKTLGAPSDSTRQRVVLALIVAMLLITLGAEAETFLRERYDVVALVWPMALLALAIRSASTGSSRAARRAGSTPAAGRWRRRWLRPARRSASGVCTGSAGTSRPTSCARPRRGAGRAGRRAPSQHHRLAEEEAEDGAPARAQRDQQADLAGALGDRDGHDGDDADAAHQQRDAAQRADRHAVSTSRMLDSVRSMSSWVSTVKSSRPWRAIISAFTASATRAAAGPRGRR